MANVLEPGFHRLSDSVYRDLPYMSQSSLKLITKSPANYKYWSQFGGHKTAALELGIAVHTKVLEAASFGDRYVRSPKFNRRSNAGKAEEQAFIDAHPGKILLSEDDWATINGIAEAVQSNGPARMLLSEGEPEVSAIWDDEETGIRCKAKYDWLRDDTVVDLKTTESVQKDAFLKSVVGYSYFRQCAYYLDSAHAIEPHRPRTFIFICVETKPPFHVANFVASKSMLEAGRESYRRDLATYKRCLQTNQWPKLEEKFEELNMPAWYGRAG